MGIMDEIGSLAGNFGGGSTEAKVAGGLVQALEQHPGGIGSVLSSFQQNGLGDHANDMATGATTTTTPEQVQQGLNGTGLIEQAAQRAGVSPQVATIAMATVLPMVMAHFAPGGQPAPQGQFGGLASQLLSKFL